MSIHSIPPELLLQIISFTSDDHPSRSGSAYHERQASLRSCSLVHSSWTAPAQWLLWRQVWIKVSSKDSRIRKFGQFDQASGENGVEYLHLEGTLESLLSLRKRKAFEEVPIIQHKFEARPKGSGQVSCYAEFRHLQALHLDWGKYLTAPCQPHSTFHKLERLSLGNFKTSDVVQLDGNVFTPLDMPKLVHLAIRRIETLDLLSAILPQIVTLAVGGAGTQSRRLSEWLPQLKDLKHLSLVRYDEAIPDFFRRPAEKRLETLHLQVDALQHNSDLAAALADIVKAKRDLQEKGRVVIYGSRGRFSPVNLSVDLDLFDWRKGTRVPPFEDFDGR